MIRELDLNEPFDSDYFKEYYENYRNEYKQLFKSEKFFFEEFLNNAKSVIDIGCASGGMYQIINEKFTNVKYKGLDISKNLINIARTNYPRGDFELADGTSLSYKNDFVDCILSLGTTVHDQEWKNLIKEAFRVCSKKLLFDIRLTSSKTINSLDLGYVLDESNCKYPYVIVNYNELLSFLGEIEYLGKFKIYGYWGEANKDTTLPKGYESICMACILLEKNKKVKNTNFDVDIKLPYQLLI